MKYCLFPDSNYSIFISLFGLDSILALNGCDIQFFWEIKESREWGEK